MLIVLGVQTCTVELARAQGVQGLTYETYAGTGASPSRNPLANPTVRSTGVSANINYPSGSFGNNILGSGLIDRVIVKWTGWINIPTSGTYQFGGSADDGIHVTIDNTVVIDSWIDSGNAFRTGTPITLGTGPVPITVWYYENGGGQTIVFQWLVNGTWQVVPTTVFATQSTYWTPVVPQYTSGITIQQQTRKNSANTRQTAVTNNSIFIDQVGDNNTITVSQQSSNNQVRGVGQQAASIQGNLNEITVRQGTQSGSITGRNLLELSVNGNSNTLNLNQGRNSDGTNPGADSNNHYQMLNLTGSTNTVTTVQKDGSNTAQGHFMENTISGNSNIINLTQQGSGGKILFGNVNGNSNSATVNQKDGGQHYLDFALTGNGHSLNVIQEGTGSHKATISLTNAGGAATVNLNQQGVNNQTYSIQQSCANPSGCTTTVTQSQ